MMEDTGFPKGYHAEHYRRDTDIFAKWLKENYPECLYVGPSATGGDVVFGKGGGGGDTWASTYLDVLRTLNELGGFSKETRGVIFHNTLAVEAGTIELAPMTCTFLVV